MFLSSVRIDRDVYVADLVRQDYRTAAVFRKYGIDFYCSANQPLSVVCNNMGINPDEVETELAKATRPLQMPPAINAIEWDIDFLIDYILNIHHSYLRSRLPFIEEQLTRFIVRHGDAYPRAAELHERFKALSAHILPHVQQEEEVLFPYVRQIAHAYADSEPYAGLLVRTLRKPMEDTMHKEHDLVMEILVRIRQLTHNYEAPEHACISHRVSFSLLRELDNDLTQHLYLENTVLFPRAIAMEKEIMQRGENNLVV